MLDFAIFMRFVDWGVILVYLLGVTWFGARFRKRQTNLKQYFLGGQTAPWWAIALSIVSAETSTLTIIGTPPLALTATCVFLQVVFGYLLARVVISVLFLPQYFRGQMFTAYELMQRRFGPRVRQADRRHFPGHARAGGGRARLCDLHCDFHHSGHRRIRRLFC